MNKLQAIKARIEGDFDHPELKKLGLLMPDILADVLRIIRMPETDSDEILLFSSDSAKEPWDSVEYYPVRKVDGQAIEQCEEGEEDFWSVYVHLTSGGLSCVADVPTKEKARELSDLIATAALSFNLKIK
jgi:hypothetical protein